DVRLAIMAVATDVDIGAPKRVLSQVRRIRALVLTAPTGGFSVALREGAEVVVVAVILPEDHDDTLDREHGGLGTACSQSQRRSEKRARAKSSPLQERSPTDDSHQVSSGSGRQYVARPPEGCSRDFQLVQPILLLEFAGKILLGEVLEVLVGEGVQLVFEPAREHPLDLLLPALLLEPRVAQELAGAGDVLVVQLDSHVTREPVRFGIPAREPDELGLGNGHALALEGEIDRALLDDRVDVVAPRVV